MGIMTQMIVPEALRRDGIAEFRLAAQLQPRGARSGEERIFSIARYWAGCRPVVQIPQPDDRAIGNVL
jgi:hypothetical protein